MALNSDSYLDSVGSISDLMVGKWLWSLGHMWVCALGRANYSLSPNEMFLSTILSLAD